MRSISLCSFAAVLVSISSLTHAFPERPIRIVAPGVGGSADFVARLIAQGLGPRLGQQVIVDNRPNGLAPVEIVMKAPPDGYTILLYGSAVWLMPLMSSYVTYDPMRDLTALTLAVSSPNIVVVPVSLAAKSVPELIALARAKAGALNYGTTGTGNATHLAAELFKSMAGVDIVRVNYKAAGTAITELIGSQIQLMFSPAGAVTPHVKSGKLRALAVTSARPSLLYPELPTVAATGLPGYASLAMSGMFAPPKTPVSIIARLNSEISQVLKAADTRQSLLNAGVEPVGSSPEELTATMRSEITRMGSVIKAAGIRADL